MSAKQLVSADDCTIVGAETLHRMLLDANAPGASVVLDASDVASADITFVQLVVSATKTLTASGGTFQIRGLSDGVAALFRRAGLELTRGDAPHLSCVRI